MTSYDNKIIGYELVNPKQLKPNKFNYRDHPKSQQAAIDGSLTELGWIDTVVVNKNTGNVVDGHLRLEQAIAKGESEVPVLYVDITEEEEKKALLLLDPISAMAKENKEKLESFISTIESKNKAVENVIRDIANRNSIAYGDFTKEVEEVDVDDSIDFEEEFSEDNIEVGMMWEIPSNTTKGSHKLICGDSRDIIAVKKMFDGAKASLFHTDPPYGGNSGNVGFTARRDGVDKLENDNLTGDKMLDFLRNTIKAWLPHLKDNCAYYIWHPEFPPESFMFGDVFMKSINDWKVRRHIVWNKEKFIISYGDYHIQSEFCYYGWKDGHRPNFNAKKNQSNVWIIPYDISRSEIGHPTAKPVELFAIPMRNHLDNNDICAEPFAGSGSQFVAGEQLGKLVYGMELEPKYCAIILKRLISMGLTPVKVEG